MSDRTEAEPRTTGGARGARLVLCATAMGLLVALPAQAQSGRFVRTVPAPTQPVVVDTATGRMWQGCVTGLSGTNCSSGNHANLTWQVALASCEDLDWGGNTDWYVPDIKEIRSIIHSRQQLPALDDAVFPGTPISYTWSSSSAADDPTRAWAAHYGSGSIAPVSKAGAILLRCVRRQ